MYKEDNHFVEAIKVRTRVKAFDHEVFFDESVSEPEYYRNAVSLLRNEVGEGDTVHIYISNGGGLVHTASLITDAMKTCKGRIVGYLSGQVCSAATAIAMYCDEWVLGDNLHYMIHNISYGIGGKATDIAAQQEFTKRWGDQLFRDTYTGFLEEGEISLALEHGKEYWFTTEEVKERLQAFAEYRQKLQESTVEEMLNVQEETAIRAEKVLQKELLSKGVVTEQELSVTEKVQNAMAELDQSLTDEAFEELLNSEEESSNQDLDRTVCAEWESSDGLITFYVDPHTYFMEGKDGYIETYSNVEFKSIQEMSYKDCKTVIKSVQEIDVPLNARKSAMLKGIVEFFENLENELRQE